MDAYVTSGRPVGSEAVLETSALRVSTATIRVELAHLEEQEMVLQLHTSGGRIPTTAGYRYYIEHLLPTPLMSDEDQLTIRHQFFQAHTEVGEWLKLAAAVLAHRAHNVAVVTPPKIDDSNIKRVELVESQAGSVLVIVVLADGTVLQEMIAVESTVTQDSLRRDADELTDKFRGSRKPVENRRLSRELPRELQAYGGALTQMLQRAAERRPQVYHQGLGEMLSRPEFTVGAHPNLADGERLRRVVDFLQQGLAMEDLLSMMAMEEGVQVVIGGEAPLADLADYSLVVGRYGSYSDNSGVLGVLGPMRMDYGRAISLVRYMSELMSDLMFNRWE